MNAIRVLVIAAAMISAAAMRPTAAPAQPLRVVLIPADGGTESGTRADFGPLFNALARSTGLRFDLRVAQSYGAVVEALCAGKADVAFVGAVTFVQARQRGCAELLAIGVRNGKSTYHAGLFARANGPVTSIASLRGRRVAFGDINSASSFVFPMAMIIEARLDPVRDLAELRLTGSHVNSLSALAQGRVDAAALSFESYAKAVRQGSVDARKVRVIARSAPIPYPPLVVSTRLPDTLKQRLRRTLADIGRTPGLDRNMIRGYGGERLDGYDTRFPARRFNIAASKMALINDDLRGAILRKSAGRQPAT